MSSRGLGQLEQLAGKRFDRRWMVRMRKRIGRNHFPTVLAAVIATGLGVYQESLNEGTAVEDRSLISQSLGVRGAKDIDELNITSLFEQVSPLAKSEPRQVRKVLQTVTEADLARARQELQLMGWALETICRLDQSGHPMIKLILTLLEDVEPSLAMLVLLDWLTARANGHGQKTDELVRRWLLGANLWQAVANGEIYEAADGRYVLPADAPVNPRKEWLRLVGIRRDSVANRRP